MATLVDKSMPAVAVLYDAILCRKGGRWRGNREILLLDIACGLSHRVLLTNLVELDGNL